jgi:hypothetical protein
LLERRKNLMNTKIRGLNLFLVLLVLGLILACLPVTPMVTVEPESPPAPPVSHPDLVKAVVQIYGLKSQDGELTPFYSGSGTLISSTGLILTSAQVASPASLGNPYKEPDALAIGLVDQPDQPPVFSYLARVIALDPGLDLAVIQISSTMDGAGVDPDSLDLPFVPLGDSDALHVGDEINLFGFPAIGSAVFTFDHARITGFLSDEGLGDHTRMATDGVFGALGFAGGLAADLAGHIVGIAVIVEFGPGDCRMITDTNGDGVVGGDDSCISLGGGVAYFRPVNLAFPMIDAARSGETYVSPFDVIHLPLPGSESFNTITWYTGTGLADCQPGHSVESFPAGTTAVAAKWTYEGMTDGEPWGAEWSLNGEITYTGQYTWDFGDRGQRYLCFYNPDGLPDGNYHLELFAGPDRTLLTTSDVVVGLGAGATPGP